jgi:type I restriction enzyme S subunit
MKPSVTDVQWARVQVRHIATVESGFGFPREEQGLEGEEYPFFKVSDMNSAGNEVEMHYSKNTVSAATLTKLGAKPFPAGTVIFPKIGAAIATEKKRLLTGPATYDNNVMGVIPGPEIDAKFVYYWLQTVRLAEISNKGPVPSLRKSAIEDLLCPLPPLSEQHRIVEILDQADRLRRLRTQADAKAERILPALFIKTFGDPATNPKGQPKKRIGELIRVRSGQFLPAKDMDTNGTYPVYGGNGISGYHSQFLFKEPVVVLGRVGMYCGAVHYAQPHSWVTDNALYVADKLEDLDDRYLEFALRVANLNQYAGRAGQPLISGSRIYPVEIFLPTPMKQQCFADRVRIVEAVSEATHKAQQRTERLWVSILHRAFTGVLTATWREIHMKELLTEMEQQARALSAQKASA